MTIKEIKWLLAFTACAWLSGCTSGQEDAHAEQEIATPPFVYTRYLTFAVPSGGMEVEFNPPVLRWPLAKGKSVAYDVRLSKDSLFASNVISVEATPWAMFNAHRKLESGEWFWQHRVTGGTWSERQRFTVASTAIDLVSPPPAELVSRVPEGHPRVLAEEAEIPRLRKMTNREDARAILAEAGDMLRRPVPKENDGQPDRTEKDKERAKKLRQDASNSLGSHVYDAVSRLCQAWILTGDPRFQQRAVAVAIEVAGWDPEGVTSSVASDFADARCMLSMALVFDTFYDELTPSQRSILTKAVAVRADGFYQSWINNQEARVLSGHVWQHILHYFFQTCLAMNGHDDRAGDWLGFAYEIFLARTPILGGTDGGWVEGVSYFRMNMETVLEIPLFIQKFTGFDFIKAHPWYLNNIDWLVYHIPPGSSSDGFGDNSEEVFSPGVDYIAYATEISRLTGNPLAAWYANECRKYENPELASRSILRWVRLTASDEIPEVSAPPVTPVLPSGRLFRDIGLASMHSDPTNTASNLMVAIRSSPFGCYGHYLADQNAFNILYGGERTFFRTGYKITMSDPHRTQWYQHTKSNNSILVDGEGQPYSTEAYGWVRKFIAGERIAYTQADASEAYKSGETREDYGVERFRRHLLLLKPDIIVVYDELEASKPVEWSWLIHSMSRIETDSATRSFRSRFENSEGVGRLWSTEATHLVLRDTFDVPAINWRASRDASGKLKSYEEDQWHLRAVTSAKVPRNRFLAVLQVSPAATLENIVNANESSSREVKVGSWTIIANLDADQQPMLRISNEEENVIFSLVGETIRLTEGGQQRTAFADVIPWHLKQSILNLSR